MSKRNCGYPEGATPATAENIVITPIPPIINSTTVQGAFQDVVNHVQSGQVDLVQNTLMAQETKQIELVDITTINITTNIFIEATSSTGASHNHSKDIKIVHDPINATGQVYVLDDFTNINELLFDIDATSIISNNKLTIILSGLTLDNLNLKIYINN